MILSDAQLESLCDTVRSQVQAYQPHLATLFQIMYDIGCRESEPLQRDRWRVDSSLGWFLFPLKGNSERTLSPWVPPVQFIAWHSGSGYPYQLMSASRIRAVFDQFSTYATIRSGNKESSAHLFRYNYMRKLAAAGMSEDAIRIKMGLASLTVVRGYLTRPLVAS